MSKYIKQEDAIYIDCILMDKIECKDCSFYDEERNVCRMVEWLDNLPTIEVSEDCISREYLLSKAYDMDNDNLVVDLKDIEDAPSVVPTCQKNRQVEREEGEWIIEEKDSIYGKKIRLTCPECGDVFDVTEAAFPHERYCRYCGSKMKG